MARTRRSRGEGTVRQREDGKWEAYTARDVLGKRRKVTASTEREVLRRLAEAKRKQAAGVDSRGERQSIGEWLERWLELVERENAASTHENYCTMVRTHVIPHIGKVRPLSALTVDHVDDLLVQLLATPRANLSKQQKLDKEAKRPVPTLSHRTVSYALSLLVASLNVAKERHYLTINVAAQATMPQQTKRAKRLIKRERFTKVQAEKLLAAIANHRNEALYRLMLSLGLRRGEALALLRDDIDLDRGLLHVRASLKRVNHKLIRDTTKTEGSERTYQLGPVLTAMMRAHLARIDEERDKIPGWQDHGYIFPSTVGTPIEPRNLLTQYKSFLRKAELPETFRIHDLRHACAVFLISQGEHPRVIMGILGHTKIATTMDIYGDMLDEVQSAATDKIAAMFTVPDEDRVLELPEPKVKEKRGKK